MNTSWMRLACLGIGLSFAGVGCLLASGGEEFQVNTYTTGEQDRARIAAFPGGGFVVTWESPGGSSGTDSSLSSIQARLLGSDGAPLGEQFQVNTYTTSIQTNGDVEALGPGGDFVATWDSRGSVGDDSDLCSIQARRYSSGGVPHGDQIQVNTYTPGFQAIPRLASDAEGNFVVVWYSFSGDRDVYRVYSGGSGLDSPEHRHTNRSVGEGAVGRAIAPERWSAETGMSGRLASEYARVAQAQRQWPQARDYLLEDLRITVEFKDEHGLSITLRSLARLWQASGDDTIPDAVAEALEGKREEVEEVLRKLVPAESAESED